MSHANYHGQLSSSSAPDLHSFQNEEAETVKFRSATESDNLECSYKTQEGSGQGSAHIINTQFQFNPAAPVFIPRTQVSTGGSFEKHRGSEGASNRIDSNHALAHALALQRTLLRFPHVQRATQYPARAQRGTRQRRYLGNRQRSRAYSTRPKRQTNYEAFLSNAPWYGFIRAPGIS